MSLCRTSNDIPAILFISQHFLRRHFSLSSFIPAALALATKEVTLRGMKRTTGTDAGDSRSRGGEGRRGIIGVAERLDEELASRADGGLTTEVTQETREAKEGSVRNIPGPALSTGRTPNPIEEEGDLHNGSFEC
jgi:hypothetical protein